MRVQQTYVHNYCTSSTVVGRICHPMYCTILLLEGGDIWMTACGELHFSRQVSY